jgi:hypothetical protein
MFRIAMLVVMGGLLLGASRCSKNPPQDNNGSGPAEGGGSAGSAGSTDHAGTSASGSGGNSSGSGGSAGSAQPPMSMAAPRCGGIAARPCPGRGTCVDDPNDSCDPKKGGADCGGICECAAVGRCIPARPTWNASPDVCDCVPPDGNAGSGGSAGGDAGSGGSSDAGTSGGGVTCGANTCADGEECCNPSCGFCAAPGAGCTKQLCPPTDPDPTPQRCGGFAGFACPGSGECIDDPSDDCDPKNGGADCGGICTCMNGAAVLCIQGTQWSSDPHVCACAPNAGSGMAGEACGKTVCPSDQTCCNASCGTCVPPGNACIQIACL